MSDRFGEITITGEEKVVTKSVKKRVKKKKPAKQPKKQKIEKTPAQKRLKLFAIFTLTPLLLFGLYCLAGFYLVPRFIVEKVPGILERDYGLQVEIDKSNFNPLSFTLQLEKLKVYQNSDNQLNEQLLTLESLTTTLDALALIRSSLVCKSLDIVSPLITITRFQDNHYNVSRYFEKVNNNESGEILNFAELPFLYSINNITIENGKIDFKDNPSGKKHIIDTVNLGFPSLSNFEYNIDNRISPYFSAMINGSPFEIIQQPESVQDNNGKSNSFTIDLDNLNLPVYTEYLPFTLPVKFTEGVAQGKLQITFAPTEKVEERLAIDFQLELEKVKLTSTDDTLNSLIDKSQIIGTYKPMARSLVFENIYIQKPTISFRDSFTKTSLDNLLPTKKEDANKQNLVQTGLDRNLSISIDRFLLDDCTLKSLPVKISGKIVTKGFEDIQLSIKDFSNSISEGSSTKNNGKFKLSGKGSDSNVTFIWDGELQTPFQASGIFKLDDVTDSSLCSLLLPSQSCSAATSEMTGSLQIITKVNEDYKQSLEYALTDSVLNFDDLQLNYKKNPWLKADNLKISSLSLSKDKLHLGDITSKRSSFTLLPVNFPQVLSQFVSDDRKELSLNSIEFTNSTLSFQNIKDRQPFTLNNVSFTSSVADKDNSKTHSLKLTATSGNNGKWNFEGTGVLNPFSLTLNTEFEGVESNHLLPFFTSNPVAKSSSGTLQGKGKYRFPKSSFFGNIKASDIEIIQGTTSRVTFSSANFTKIAYRKVPFSLQVDKAQINRPDFTWDVTTKSQIAPDAFNTFLTTVLPTTKLPKPTKQYKYPFYAINQLSLVGVEFGVTDNRSLTHVTSSFKQVEATFNKLKYPSWGKEAQFTIKGDKDGIPFSLKGSGDFLKPSTNGKAVYSFENISQTQSKEELQDIKLDISNANISGTVTSEWFNKQLFNDVNLTAKRIRPTSAESLSALSLAFLYGTTPDITISFKQNNSPEIPSTPLRQATINNFKRNLIKAQISPLLLAKDDYSDLIDVTSVPFGLGQSSLSGEARETLSRLADLLINHPLLSIQLSSNISSEDERAISADLEVLEKQRVVEENDRLFKEWQKRNEEVSAERENLLIDQTGEEIVEQDLSQFEIEPFTPITANPVAVNEEDLLSLAAKRLEAVQFLLTDEIGIPSQQVNINTKNISRTEGSQSSVSFTYSTLFKPENTNSTNSTSEVSTENAEENN